MIGHRPLKRRVIFVAIAASAAGSVRAQGWAEHRSEDALGRFAGRAFTLVESSTLNVAVRLYWSRGKLYQLPISGRPGIETQPDTRNCFESFGLLKT